MPNNIVSFEGQNGVEILIDTVTSESFASVRGYARMSGKSLSTISRRLNDTVTSKLRTEDINTSGGSQKTVLIPEQLFCRWIIKDNPVAAMTLSNYYATNGNKKACDILSASAKVLPIIARHIKGCIYVLYDSNNQAYKVGFTTEIAKRLKAHKTSNPFLELVMQFDRKLIENEQLLHRQLKKYKVAGTSEWYHAHEHFIPTINILMSSL